MKGSRSVPASKRCSKCQLIKALTEYQRDASQSTGYKSACKTCSNKARGERREGAPYENPLKEAARRAHVERKAIEATGTGQFMQRLKDEGKWPGSEVEQYEEFVLETPKSEPKIEVVEEVITHIEEHRLKKQVRELAAQLKSRTAEMSDAALMAELLEEVRAMPPVAGIQPRERTSGLAEATPLVLASDWHIEEEVRPEQVANRNRYNLDISKQRMERFFEATRWGIGHQREIFKIRDLVLWLGGDIITNYLHPDNVETNLLSPVEAIAYAQSSIGDGIRFLLQDPELERVVIPCNDGNHGRLTPKMHSASRIENSIEWLLYTELAREFRDEDRVEFILPTSAFTFFEVYDRTIRFTHGDTVRYGGGVGGITIPLYKALARWESVVHADLTCIGHFHQRICLPDLMVNGSLIGYNSYAMDIGARFEPPVQSMRILDSKRFGSTDIPLWVGERADDHG